MNEFTLRPISITIDVVSAWTGVSREDILAKSRSKHLVMARKLAMYIARVRLSPGNPFSYPEIGRCFGNRDHTTVMYSVRSVRPMYDGSHRVDAMVDEIMAMLGRPGLARFEASQHGETCSDNPIGKVRAA